MGVYDRDGMPQVLKSLQNVRRERVTKNRMYREGGRESVLLKIECIGRGGRESLNIYAECWIVRNEYDAHGGDAVILKLGFFKG